MRLGAAGRPSHAQLDGFKSRALRAEAPTQRHMYATEWRSVDLASTTCPDAPILILADERFGPADGVHAGSSVSRAQLAARVGAASASSLVVAAVGTQRGQLGRDALFALEVALTLVQAAAGAAGAPKVWLLKLEHMIPATRALSK